MVQHFVSLLSKIDGEQRNRNDQEVEARSERNFDEIQKFINDLEKDIAATSTEPVKAKITLES